ncbi:hypothetical protein ILUMI_13221 [Ignelater luminosus]|uniref:Uncharacterized protein n=1 Tax=Ignelater luminosus TaxID=2038154 RepID=A0A8K0CX51_IGNLU|nr:hypothetical protein ILUMI_13221 [Ignelater luminosus]
MVTREVIRAIQQNAGKLYEMKFLIFNFCVILDFDPSHLGTAENGNEMFDDSKENVTNNTECPKENVNGPLNNSSESTYKNQSNFLQAENNNLSNTCIERNSVAQHLDNFPGSSENIGPFANFDDMYELRQIEKGDQCYCYVWGETQGQRRAKEVGSCLFKYLEQKSKANPDLIIFR